MIFVARRNVCRADQFVPNCARRVPSNRDATLVCADCKADYRAIDLTSTVYSMIGVRTVASTAAPFSEYPAVVGCVPASAALTVVAFCQYYAQLGQSSYVCVRCENGYRPKTFAAGP